MHNTRKQHKALFKAIAALTAMSAAGHLQAEVLALEEVIVTAQKREQGLGDVPLSIQAVGGDALEEQNIFDFAGLVDRLPNINVDVGAGQTAIRMRGIGTGNANTAAEQAVGMYIDGVYISRSYQANAPFTDVERVEVLNGPQSVLQGKNSAAGAVVITTRRPTDEFEAILRGSYEVENEGYNLEGIVSGPLTDNIFGRLVAQQNFVGGWLDTNTRLAADGVTVLRGKDDQNEDEFTQLRASLVWDATDTLSLFAKIETGDREISGVTTGGYAIQPGATTPGGEPILDDFLARDPNYGFITDGVVSNGFRNEYNEELNLFEAGNGDIENTISSDAFTFQFDWEIGLGTVTGITGYSEYERGFALARSMAPVDVLTDFGEEGDGGETLDQFTQEIRLVSPGGETIDYIIGAFYMDRNVEEDPYRGILNFSNGGLPAPPSFDMYLNKVFKENTEAWSVFGQVTWTIVDTLRLNAGLRYTDETKTVDPYNFGVEFLIEHPVLNQIALDQFGFVPFTTEDLPRDEVADTSTDPSLSLQWDATDEIMLYAAYTEATKAGGFAAGAPAPDRTSFDPEYATGYEIGLKGRFLDGRLLTNLAIFHTEYEDLQVSALDTATNSFFFKNAAEATTEGFEFDFRFAATEELELGGAIGYADATYDDFPGATCSEGLSQEPDCDLATNSRNAAGDKLQGAPEWTGNLYADYRYALSNGMELGLQGTLIYSDDFYLNAQNDPFLLQDDFTKLDLVASLTSSDGSWKLSIIGKNVTDETTSNFGGGNPFYPGQYFANVDAPRQIFLNAEYRWY